MGYVVSSNAEDKAGGKTLLMILGSSVEPEDMGPAVLGGLGPHW